MLHFILFLTRLIFYINHGLVSFFFGHRLTYPYSYNIRLFSFSFIKKILQNKKNHFFFLTGWNLGWSNRLTTWLTARETGLYMHEIEVSQFFPHICDFSLFSLIPNLSPPITKTLELKTLILTLNQNLTHFSTDPTLFNPYSHPLFSEPKNPSQTLGIHTPTLPSMAKTHNSTKKRRMSSSHP